MAISQFPPAAGGAVGNDFILDKADSDNNTFILPREFESGGYAITVAGNDSTFDIYLVNSAGSTVGYTNGSAVVASDSFDTVVVLGIGTAATVEFVYAGPSTDATAQGDETGAGAYLTSVSPSDLPQIDDTATAIGGNFATDVEFAFISGTTVLPAKSIVRTDSTAAIITRPDNLVEDLAPYDLRVINPGVTPPTGSNAHILAGTITAGLDPAFVTTSPILGAAPSVAFSTSILTSDSEGSVVNWTVTAGTVPPGLTLASATGSVSGTPTTAGDYYFTVQITDDGGNTNSAEFNLPVGAIVEQVGGASTVVGGTSYVYFTTSGDLVYKNLDNTNLEYLVVAGGGGGGGVSSPGSGRRGGGGGAGGLLHGTAAVSGAGTVSVVVGAGGNASSNAGGNGVDSVVSIFGTAIGGGGGGGWNTAGSSGGSGGGGGGNAGTAGTGISGQGNNGATSGGGGGGAGAAATSANGGSGALYGAYASAVNLVFNGGYFAGGGGGANANNKGGGGAGGGGAPDGATQSAPGNAGSANSGGGGGAAYAILGGALSGGTGGAGVVIVKVG